MKKELLDTYGVLLREHMPIIYRKACTVTGAREKAEALTTQAILYSAKKFSGLSNKTLVLNIILDRIGDGNSAFFEPIDYDALLEKILERLRTQYKRKRFAVRVSAVMTVLLLGTVILFSYLGKEENMDENLLLMSDTKVLQGDESLIQFINYQNLSLRLDKKGAPEIDETRRIVTLDRMASMVTAPDGTVYAAYHNLESEDGGDNTFTLWLGNEKGWESVGSGNITAREFEEYEMSVLLPSEIHVVADRKSNAYVISRLDEAVTIYKYDKETQSFTQTASIPFTYIYFHKYVSVKYDPEYGENGTIYLACTDDGTVTFYSYDTATDEVEIFFDTMYLYGSKGSIDFCVKDHVIHMYESNSSCVWYTRILSDGSYENKQLYKPKSYAEKMHGIEIDEGGTVHILTRAKEASGRTGNVVHYIISEDGQAERSELAPLYYDESSYIAGVIGMFVGNDGNVYYMEHYQSFVSLGKLGSENAAESVYVDGAELLDYCDTFYSEGKDILFYTYDANYTHRQIASFRITGEFEKNKLRG